MSTDAKWSITNRSDLPFSRGLAADVDTPEFLFSAAMPPLERLVHPAPLDDPALPVDPEVRP